MHMRLVFRILAGLCAAAFSLSAQPGPSLLESLDRGVVALRTSATDTFVSWRLLGTDPAGVTFNVYRQVGDGVPVKVNADPLAGGTNLTDQPGGFGTPITYTVTAIVGGDEQPAGSGFTLPANVAEQSYLSIPLDVPAGGTTPDGVDYTYHANDTSVGDLDGDGDYEIIVKWDPSNAQDNSNAGYTGNVFLDAYQLDGTRLWRIDLGVNIRAGAHYTQFLVYDFDGDGRAELVCKTAPGTRDGTGTFIAQPGKFQGTPSAPIDHSADYRNNGGYILTGPEFYTVFDGLTGAELASANYPVPRNNNPASPDVSAWGDNYGNRVDRFLAGVAYLDGQRPSILLCRGYYTRATIAAIDWRDGELRQRWLFDTGYDGTASPWANWRGQGAHSLTIGDVDGDGRDEIIYGAAAIDDHGGGLYSTLLGHGDALHLSDMLPSRPGLEIWMSHESPASYGSNGADFRDARTGEIIFGVDGQGADVGRAVAMDIDPDYPGYEMWASRGAIMSATGVAIAPTSTQKPGINFALWWDGDLLREVLDGTVVSKWEPVSQTISTLLAPEGVERNNGTKANPALSGDIIGDWREEVLWRATDSSEMRLYTTAVPTEHRITTLMHDRQYRLAIAWQNVGYNQPPHPSFFLGEAMSFPPPPNIVTSLSELGSLAPAAVGIDRYLPNSPNTTASSVTFRVSFNQPVTGVDAGDFTLVTTGTLSGTIASLTAATSMSYDIVVNGLVGDGTVRIDLNASGTGITGSDGTPIVGGFTGGNSYARTPPANGTWINPAGGDWSVPGNWEGPVADGADNTANFNALDLTGDIHVTLDGDRTIGHLVFSDLAAATAGNWRIVGDDTEPRLTLEVEAGAPTVTVGTMAANSAAIIDVPLISGNGLNKLGPGILALSAANEVEGTLNVSSGRVRIDEGGSYTAGVVTIASGGAQLNIAGGEFEATSSLTVSSGGGSALVVDGGTATFTTLATTNSAGGIIRINGGNVTATSVNLPRSNDNSTAFGNGLIVAGGLLTVNGTVGIGTNNSYGVMSIEGGELFATGNIRIGDLGSNSTRGGVMRVTAGRLTSTDLAGGGLVFSNRNANTSLGFFTGGVTTVEAISLGGVDIASGSVTITVDGGSIYLGSGGLVKRGATTMSTTLNLTSGLLGAKDSWSSNVPFTLTPGGSFTFHAADESGIPNDITLNGVLSGSGTLNKTGGGLLVLAGANTHSGNVVVDEGELQLTGSLADGGTLSVGAGARLSGTGTSAKAVDLHDGGTIAAQPGLSLASLLWHGGGTVELDLSAGVPLAIAGELAAGEAGARRFVLAASGALEAGTPIPLVTFASTNLTAAEFTVNGPAGYSGFITVDAHAVSFTPVPSGPSGWYDTWAAQSGLPPEARAPDFDADGDGQPNLLEFALALDPTMVDQPDVMTTTITVGGKVYPSFVYVRRGEIGGVELEVEVSSTPSFDALHPAAEVSATPQDDGTILVVARSTVPLSNQPHQFFRLTATLPTSSN